MERVQVNINTSYCGNEHKVVHGLVERLHLLGIEESSKYKKALNTSLNPRALICPPGATLKAMKKGRQCSSCYEP